MELLLVFIPLGVLVLVIFSAYGLARRVTDALSTYGRPWAILGGVAAFVVAFCIFGGVSVMALSVTFGR